MKNETTVVNIIFDAARGEVPVAAREAKVGEPLGNLPTPVRRGYRFEGWTVNGKPVDASTVLDTEEDACLVAVWVRQKETKKSSMYKKQRTAVVILAALSVLLVLTLVLAKNLVTIYGLTDTYYTASGEEQTEKYYVRKKGGVYGLYDRKGNLMEINEQGYYIVRSGNQYSVDAETGACELYAVVDYDAAGGESLGYSDRIMIFPQITQQNTYSIEVKNEFGSYTFYRDGKGNVKIKGFDGEDSTVMYDKERFAQLCSACGYTLTQKKLDFSPDNPSVPRLADGSVDLSVYGLSDADSPAIYTVTKAVYDEKCVDNDGQPEDGYCTADPNAVYTVKVGDLTLSGGGYYVQLEGRNAVYIMEATNLGPTVMQSIESLITPMISSPVTDSTYPMVQSFLLGKVDFNGSFETVDKDTINLTVAFSYWDLEERMNSIYSSRPYVCRIDGMMEGYEINSDNASNVLLKLHQMEFIACKKLGITEAALKEYGFDGKVHYLSYQTPVTGSNNAISGYVQNEMLISPKTENGTYYVASFLTDMIVEVDQYYFSFLQWEVSDWYEQYFFSYDVANINSLGIQVGNQKYEFLLDNAASYMYYEKDGQMEEIDLKKGTLRSDSQGGFIYTDENGTDHKVIKLDLDRGKSYIAVFDAKGNELGRAPYEKYLLTAEQYPTVDATGKTVLGENIVLRLYESADSDVYSEYMISQNDLNYRLIYVDGDNQYDVIGSYSTSDGSVRDYYRLTVWIKSYDLEAKAPSPDWVRNTAPTSTVSFYTKDGKEIVPRRGSSNLQVYSEQYNGENGGKLDYTIVHTYLTDRGTEKTETITAVDNFRRLYSLLAWYSIEGDVDPEEFQKNTGMTVPQFIAQGDSACQAIFTYNLRDLAVNTNFMTSSKPKDENDGADGDTGEDNIQSAAMPELKVWRDNNEAEVVVRLYRYSDRKSLITIEVIDLYDENGNRIENPVSDPTKAEGIFYVQTSYADRLLEATEMLLNKELIETN